MNFLIRGMMLSCFILSVSADPILIMTHNYTRPDFIEIQYKTFKKFLKDDYEFVVFNDAPGAQIYTQINEVCARLGIKCVRIPQEIHTYAYLYRMPGESFNNPNVRCANVVQYSLNEMGFKYNGIVMIIDADMFLVKEFSVKEFMNGYDIAGLDQSRGNGRVQYIWNGLVFFDMRTLPNKNQIDFNCGRVEGEPVDVGGYMHHYFKNNPSARKRLIDVLNTGHCKLESEWLRANNFDDAAIDFILKRPHNVEFLLRNHFFHYRGGGNWDNKSQQYHQEKTRLLQTYVNEILSK